MRRVLRRAFVDPKNAAAVADSLQTFDLASGKEKKSKKKQKGKSAGAQGAGGLPGALPSLESDHPPPRPGGRRSGTDQWVLVEPFWLEAGPLEPDDWSVEDPHTKLRRFVVTRYVRRTLRCVAAAISSGNGAPVLLQGPTSAGKTYLVEYLAARTGHRCVRINNHEHTDIAEYLGSYTSAAAASSFGSGSAREVNEDGPEADQVWSRAQDMLWGWRGCHSPSLGPALNNVATLALSFVRLTVPGVSSSVVLHASPCRTGRAAGVEGRHSCSGTSRW